jgi:hypothetical protein
MRNINAKISYFLTTTFNLEIAKSEFRETISKNMKQNVSFKNIENIEKEINIRNPKDYDPNWPYLVFNIRQSTTWSNVTVDIVPLQENSFSYVTSGMGG